MSDSPIPSMGKVWNFGHGVLAELFTGPVIAQEKVEGSPRDIGKLMSAAKQDLVDEEREQLGQELKLPPWEEPNRAAIEAGLPPVSHP